MVILNPFCCPSCERELYPEDLGVKTNEKGELVRICLYCNDEVVVVSL